MRLDLFAKIDDVLLAELPDRDVRHSDSIVVLLLCQLDLKLFCVLVIDHIPLSCLFVRKTKLLRHVGVVQEVVLAEDSLLVVLIELLLLRDDVRRVDLGRDIDSVVDVAWSVSRSSNLASLRLGVRLKTLSRLLLVSVGYRWQWESARALLD